MSVVQQRCCEQFLQLTDPHKSREFPIYNSFNLEQNPLESKECRSQSMDFGHVNIF